MECDVDRVKGAPEEGWLASIDGAASPPSAEFAARFTLGVAKRTSPSTGFFGCAATGGASCDSKVVSLETAGMAVEFTAELDAESGAGVSGLEAGG